MTPDWFLKAVATPYDERTVNVTGTPIRYLDWGTRETAHKPGLVLVHGGAAHAQWWSFLAPLFMERHRVLALHLSGHGDSGRREAYTLSTWAAEIMAVAEDADLAGPPSLIGHSLGGLVTIEAAATYGQRLAGAIIVDAPVRRPDPESESASRGDDFRRPGTYPDLATAMQRFRLVPGQPCANDYLIEHIARHSLHETDAGWTWKFDPKVFAGERRPVNEKLAAIDIRVALLRGEWSVVVPPDTADYMYEVMGGKAPVVSIPEAHHHLILDQPLAFVAAVRTFLAEWEHSIRHPD